MPHDIEMLKTRIEQSLRELPLTDEDIAKVAPEILENASFLKEDSIGSDSHFFAFKEKITGVVDRFKDDGLRVDDYLKAAVKQPPLFAQSPDTIEGNIRSLVAKFKDDGLTLGDYLKAAVKQPTLFTQLPDTLERNIRNLVAKFKDDGLTLGDYLKAAVKQPPLFYQSPDTIESNIRGLVAKFKDDGLTLGDYLKAAVKQPQLFCQSPDTIAGHINMMIEMYRKEIISFNGNATNGLNQPLKPLFDFLIKNPTVLCFADDNFALREIHAHVAEAEPSQKILREHRHAVEKNLMGALGHADKTIPVPKLARDETSKTSHAQNLLLRALIREGIVKGSLEQER